MNFEARRIQEFDRTLVGFASFGIVDVTTPSVVPALALHGEEDLYADDRTGPQFRIGVEFVGMRLSGLGIDWLR